MKTIDVEHIGTAAVLRLNRPERRNAVSLEMMHELGIAAEAAAANRAVSAVIITGNERGFSSGADLGEVLEVETAAQGVAYFANWHRLTRTLEGLSKPVIAAIEGYCMTGGCELALACDMRIAGKGSSFAITSSRIGTVPGAGGTQRLPRIVGVSNALEMLLSSEPIDSDEAFRIGLINRQTAKGGALDEALKFAQVLSERAPLSLSLIKKAVYGGIEMDLATALSHETFVVTTIYGTRDKKEGVSAFLEKRTAKFTGE